MGEAKKSYVKDEHGKITGINYTEERGDGKTETRHYSKTGVDYLGRTVSDDEGHSTHYNHAGRED